GAGARASTGGDAAPEKNARPERDHESGRDLRYAAAALRAAADGTGRRASRSHDRPGLDLHHMATTEQTEFIPQTDELLYERRGPIATLTFNRPQARNALTWAM